MRFDRAAWTMLLALAAALACAAPTAAQGVAVSGQVVDAESGRPVSGAVVQLDAATRALADREGRFSLRRVAPGAYDVVVSRIGYQRRGERWTVVAGRPLDVTVRLAPEPVELAGVEGRGKTEYERALDRNLDAIAASTRLFGEADFERTVSPSAADFVRMHTRILYVRCPLNLRYRDCVRWRKQTIPLVVRLNERAASDQLTELEAYPLSEIARVEVIDGRVIRVYTRDYVRRSAEIGRIPMP